MKAKELGRGCSSCFFLLDVFCCSRFVWFVLVWFLFMFMFCFVLFVCLFCFLIEYSTNSKSPVDGIFDELMILAPFFPSIVRNLRKFDPIIL